MMGIVAIDQHKIVCTIGVYPHEKIHKQEIFVDIKAEVDITKSARSDSLDDALNYVTVADLCTQIAQKKHYHLLEALANDILKALMSSHKDITWCWVKVRKPLALLTAISASVEVQEKRE